MKMNKERKNLLVFGYGLAIILSFIGIRLGMKEGWGLLSFILITGALFFTLITRFCLDKLKPFYRNWMKVAHFIGMIITGIILSILFYGVFSPVGIILRILKKDLLEQSLDNSCASYWHNKEEKEFDKKHYLRQF